MPEVLAIVDQHGDFVKGQYAHNDFTTVLLGPSDIKTRIKFGIRGIVLNLTRTHLKNSFDKNNNASQMNKSEVILKKSIIANQNVAVVL